MRTIALVRVGEKTRPALVLTREAVRRRMTNVTVVPITSTVRGIGSEVAIPASYGVDHDSVASVDNVVTVKSSDLLREIGWFPDSAEPALSAAITYAFDLVQD